MHSHATRVKNYFQVAQEATAKRGRNQQHRLSGRGSFHHGIRAIGAVGAVGKQRVGVPAHNDVHAGHAAGQ